MANTEQIEAKLCAYVDGELDAAGRAEIEQHLAANPQHRALLEELIAQREMLRELPREKAPEDLYETFQNQLERAVLLGAKGTGSPVAGRINPWPQIFSVAAVILLAIGLFAVIYFVLPSQQRRASNYATVTTSPAGTQPMPEAVADSSTAMRKVASTLPATPAQPVEPVPIAVAVAPAATPPPSIMPPTMTNSSSNDVFANIAGTDAAVARRAAKGEGAGIGAGALSGLFDSSPLEPEIEQKLKDSPHLPDKCMVVVVASADPVASDQQVTQYLAQNKIRWDDVPEPMPKPLEMKRSETYASKIQRPQTYELRERAARPLGKGDAVASVEKDQKQEVAKAPGAAAAPPVAQSATPAPAVAPSEPAAAATPEPAPVAVAPPPAPAVQATIAESQAAQVPATQPAIETANGGFQQPQQQGQQLQVQQQRVATTFDEAAVQTRQGQAGASQRLIVARGVTRSQLAELNSSIIAQNAGKLSNFTCADGSIVRTTPALASNVRGQLANQAGVTTQRDDYARDAIDATKEKSFEPTTLLSPAETPPPATPAPTTAAASQPTVSGAGTIVLSGGAAATTQPATTISAGDRLAMDEREKLFARGAATLPTESPATMPSDDAFDVVIVVQQTIAPEPPLAAEPAPPAAAPAPAVTLPATPPDAAK